MIPGIPIPQKRPRLGKGHTYNPQANLKEDTSWVIKAQRKSFITKSPLHIDFIFFMPIPKSKKKKIKPGDFHAVKPDADNLEKFYLDAATGILFFSDAQVCSLRSLKIYDNNPRTIMRIYNL